MDHEAAAPLIDALPRPAPSVENDDDKFVSFCIENIPLQVLHPFALRQRALMADDDDVETPPSEVHEDVVVRCMVRSLENPMIPTYERFSEFVSVSEMKDIIDGFESCLVEGGSHPDSILRGSTEGAVSWIAFQVSQRFQVDKHFGVVMGFSMGVKEIPIIPGIVVARTLVCLDVTCIAKEMMED